MIAIKKHAETLGFLYAFCIVIISFVFTSDRAFFASPGITSSSGPHTLPHQLSASPLVGKRNESSVISSQVNLVKLQFEKMLTDPSVTWQVLRSIPGINLTVSVHYSDLKHQNGHQYQQPYIKSSVLIESSVKEAYKLFLWRQLHDTLCVVDPLYESSQLISKVSRSTNILRKTTKRLVVFPKREFFLAYSLFEQHTPIHINGNHKISSGSKVASFVSIRLNQNDYTKYRNSASHVQASQDYFTWFSRIKNDSKDNGMKRSGANSPNYEDDMHMSSKEYTLINTISRVDLSLNIPRWPLETSMGNAAAGSMMALKKLAERR